MKDQDNTQNVAIARLEERMSRVEKDIDRLSATTMRLLWIVAIVAGGGAGIGSAIASAFGGQ